MKKILWTGVVVATIITGLGIVQGILKAEAKEVTTHPADLNTDWRLVLSEAIAYLSGWQTGSNPMAYAIRAAYLWQNGEQYHYDFTQVEPMCWEIGASAIAAFSINGGEETTMSLSVVLNNSCQGPPSEYMASESAAFTGATWETYDTAPSFTLSFGVGERTVYFKVRDGIDESDVVSDSIFIVPNMVFVDASTFTMGRTDSGDDADYGLSDEDPRHEVTLSAYQLGKYEVTNKEYCDVLNWALAQGYLMTNEDTAWTGTGDIYAGGPLARYLIVAITQPTCNIQYSDGVFTSKTRTVMPNKIDYSMDTHPMIHVSWYGSVAFCNWLSQWQGMTPCYDMQRGNWFLVTPPGEGGGYRLPTEAEWERAAGWGAVFVPPDDTYWRHYIYSFRADTLTGGDRANYDYCNPLGLLPSDPPTSPVGWFNGTNVSPNGNTPTVNSRSPVQAYDMSGNVWEWCHDWYNPDYYLEGAMTNPTGPGMGWYRVSRGGGWGAMSSYCRSAVRGKALPATTDNSVGFRLSRSQ